MGGVTDDLIISMARLTKPVVLNKEAMEATTIPAVVTSVLVAVSELMTL